MFNSEVLGTRVENWDVTHRHLLVVCHLVRWNHTGSEVQAQAISGQSQCQQSSEAVLISKEIHVGCYHTLGQHYSLPRIYTNILPFLYP